MPAKNKLTPAVRVEGFEEGPDERRVERREERHEDVMKEIFPKLLEVIRDIRPDPKITTFEGNQSEDISMWFKDFRRMTEGLGKSENYLVNLAKLNIKGSAKIFLNQIPDEEINNLDKLEREMTRIFGRKLTPGDYKDKLFNLKFEDFESVEDLAQNISILVPNAYPKRARGEWDETMLDFFLTVLPFNIRGDIKHANPKDFSAAVKEAKYFIGRNKTVKRKTETLANTEVTEDKDNEEQAKSSKRAKTREEESRQFNSMHHNFKDRSMIRNRNYVRNKGKWFIQKRINNRMRYPYRNYDYKSKNFFHRNNGRKFYQDRDKTSDKQRSWQRNSERRSFQNQAKIYQRNHTKPKPNEIPSSKSSSNESLN